MPLDSPFREPIANVVDSPEVSELNLAPGPFLRKVNKLVEGARRYILGLNTTAFKARDT